jgi:hypothetical protein
LLLLAQQLFPLAAEAVVSRVCLALPEQNQSVFVYAETLQRSAWFILTTSATVDNV